MDEALYIREGDLFVPTELTRGGWTDDAQHGSPPSGLLGRAVESVPTAVPMHIVRLTIDLFRPVPLRPLRVVIHMRRAGKRIQVVDALLYDGDVELGRAAALKLRITDLDLPDSRHEHWAAPTDPAPTDPESVEVLKWAGYGDTSMRRFHYDGVEIRSIDESFVSNQPGLSWFRLKHPLVAGEDLTPFTRLATLSDMANGNSRALDPDRWVFVNPDTTIYCHRLPIGDYLGMHSGAVQHRSGIGMTDTWVFDEVGPVGRINQAQLIEPRPID